MFFCLYLNTLIQDMNRMEFIPIKGSYDRDTEFKMFSTCYSKGSIFYKIVRYQLEVLMRDKHLTDNEVVEAFRCKGDEEWYYVKKKDS